MLKFVAKYFSVFFEIVLWLILMFCPIVGGIIAYSSKNSFSYTFLGILIGLLIGFIIVLFGGLVANFLTLCKNIQLLVNNKLNINGTFDENNISINGNLNEKIESINKKIIEKMVNKGNNVKNIQYDKIVGEKWICRNCGYENDLYLEECDNCGKKFNNRKK